MSTISQRQFMMTGGIYAPVLQKKYDSGELVPPEKYQYQEYPKLVRISRGIQRVERHTELIRGRDIVPHDWVEEVEQFSDILVNSEAEEERVLNGGKSEAQIEQERQELFTQCKQRNIHADPSWSLLRLQRELGAAPSREAVDALQARVAQLETEAALKARIQELEALIAGKEAAPKPVARNPESAEEEQLRQQLTELGVEVDGRWGLLRLRRELETATAPA